MSMKLGTAKLDITPTAAIRLAGFSNRKEVCTVVARPLNLRVWLFQQEQPEEAQVLLVQADLIWWGTAHVQAMKSRIADRWSIPLDNILFHASHTHGGPQTTGEFSPDLAVADPSYITFLEQKVEQAIATAYEQLEEVTLELGTGACPGIGINRRKIVNGQVAFEPNPLGPHDEEVTVLHCRTMDNRTKGLLFHYTCHPTTTSANRVDAEYCGVAMEQLDQMFGEGASCFLQGCCGNIRPYLERDGQFYNGSDEEIVRAGVALATAVADVVQRPMKRLTTKQLTGAINQANLPFQAVSLDVSHAPEDEDELAATWRRMKREGKLYSQAGPVLDIQLLQLADEFSLLAMNGEMVVEYGLWAKQQSPGLVPLGYSNGMVGYVPTAQQIAEGGYEAATSGFVFSYPAQLDPVIETNIKTAITVLLGNARS